MASIIQLRRDTAANWTSANPTLAQGELGVETDTDKVKLGDGSTAWASLSYLIDGAQYLTSETTTSLALSGSTLTYTDETGAGTDIDLSGFLDEDARAIASGTLNGTTGIATFTRDDATTFTVDLSALLDDTNAVTSVGGATGDVTLTGGQNVSVDGTIISVPNSNIWNAFTFGSGLSFSEGTLTSTATGGGASSLNDLSDVNIVSTPDSNNFYLKWSTDYSAFIPSVLDVSSYFDSNADVWNAFTFGTGISNVEGTVNVSLDAFSIEALNDVNTMTPTDGQVLTWDDANSRWDAADASGGGSTDLSEYVGAVGITGDFTLNGDAYFNSSIVEKGQTAIFANEGSAYIDCLNGNVFLVYLSSNSVQYFSNTPASNDSYTCTVIVNQETGSNTLTWFGGIQWAGGTAPSLSTGKDIFVLSYVSGTWYGAKVAEDVSAAG